MASAQSRIVWALQVDVATLVTHLETEMLYKPVIDMLRCCHSFGTGEKVYITTLPVELIDMIADFLLAAKSAQRDAQYDDKALVVSTLTERGDIAAAKHTKEEVDQIVINAIHSGCVKYRDRHTRRRDDWQYLVGKPHQYLGHKASVINNEFMRKMYGLEVFVAHKQIGNCTYDTLAYLILPNTWTHPHTNGAFQNEDTENHDSHWMEKECGENPGCRILPGRCTGEDAIIHAVVVPPPLTPKEQARFPRMERLLGLPSEKMMVDRACTSGAVPGEDDKQYLERSLQLTMITRLWR
ncbi:hypothetical protein LTR56_015066 [Elasticomyces elasticus]|nr:hypothetical protein LTR56_015066 [Elasticomyces elasticus]KAK3639288.1 hypothetical protein LTR22_017489 [Elasticomyces elasticus]KAK4915701.1 hypothetical protein LTR49_016185 [Elasticomyces elasticus]KAK5746288.1 hypothetical protein LTS12_022811 [Elasticomyces elasticus]